MKKVIVSIDKLYSTVRLTFYWCTGQTFSERTLDCLISMLLT